MKKHLSVIAIILIIAILCGAAWFIYSYFNKEAGPKNNKDLFNKTAEELYGYREDRDSDGDGLNDHEEHHTYGTNHRNSDSDHDFLYDGQELELGTDPLNPDTDGDGIADGTEVKANSDPLKKNAKEKFQLTIETEDAQAAFSLNGNAGIYDAVMEPFAATGLKNTPGVLSECYWVYSKENYKGQLTITIPLTSDAVSIYKLENTSEYTKIDTDIEHSEDATTVKAVVGNGKYLVGICNALDKGKDSNENIDVFLLIDDSGSMYNELMDGAGSDPDYKRIDMCRQLLNNAPKSMRFGLAMFTADYMPKYELTAERDGLLAELDKIVATPYEDKEDQFNGTYIATSLFKALDNFSNDSYTRQVLVILTDGATTEGKSIMSWFDDTNTVDEVIKKANERNVSIITVALGNEVDVAYLTEIETATDGAYIYASNANAMEDLYAAILNAVNYNFMDNDNDGEADTIILSDNGFRPEADGLSFENPVVVGNGFDSFGLCYGMSSFCSLYYQKELPSEMDKMDITDWDLWFLRYSMDIIWDPVIPYEVDGFGKDDYLTAGFQLDDKGKVIYDQPLYAWSSSVMDDYTEYFKWDFESDYFDASKQFTEKALQILDATDYMVPLIYSKDNAHYPALDLRVSEEELSGDSLKTHAFLRILMRYHVSQFNEDTQSGYTYLFTEDFEVIKESVASGIPLMVCANNHATILCRLRQDIENPRLFYFDMYDCNYPGKGLTMSVEVQYNTEGEKYATYTYGEATTDATLYYPHFE